MFQENYKWHYDYVRLATDTGFAFQKYKTENFDKSKISLIDIDRVIKEADIGTVEKFIPSVIQFVLDSEQIGILDDSFAKTFRLSQLAIEYLLFCKRYLDNTIVLLKKELQRVESENRELKLFVEDLKAHVSTLMKELKERNASTFKCEECNKIFSSEEFLNSHKRRRHKVQLNADIETDKLQLEIKELKGRLNSAEKLIQKEQNLLKSKEEGDSNLSKESESKIVELQQRFEDLRTQVQSELRILQTQYHCGEKYEKWIEKMAFQTIKVPQVEKESVGDILWRRESTTQTDIDTIEISKPDTEKQITELGEAIETKVSSSLERIESQMQSFWVKLRKMEERKHRDPPRNLKSEQSTPQVKPRSKFKSSTVNTTVDRKSSTMSDKIHEVVVKNHKESSVSDEDEKIVKEYMSSKNFEGKEAEVKVVDHESTTEVQAESDDEISSVASSGSSLSESLEESVKSLPKVEKTPISNKDNEVDSRVLERCRNEVETVIKTRLQQLGVSPDWTGLPLRSFERAVEIVYHQAALLKKTYSDFDIISSHIEREVNQECQKQHSKSLQRIPTEEKPKGTKTEIISQKVRLPSPRIVEIKHRHMYEETDSESDTPKPGEVKNNLKRFSAVIEELKTVTSSRITNSDDQSVSDNEKKIIVNKNEEHANKGVLKSFPSVGSLTKKRVLFNLNNENEKSLPKKNEGSTTSVASSVLDGTPRKIQEDKEKEIEDLSDFDFSEM